MGTKILDYHNNIRAQCSSKIPPLTWDCDLAAYAQSYSDETAAAKQCNHTYNGHDPYTYSGYPDGAGENLYCNEGGQASVTDDSLALSSVNAWANEGFGAGANPNADETGHYSAMNWRSATKLGCGIGRDSGTGWAVVTCNYADTPSNYIPQSVGNLITSDPSLSEYVILRLMETLLTFLLMVMATKCNVKIHFKFRLK